MDLPTYNLILNSILLGIILITQIVSYPLFKNIDTNFSRFHKEYVSRIGRVVAPIMILEIIVAVIMLITDPENKTIFLIFCLLAMVWISTFFLQVPAHNHLSKKKSIQGLITTSSSLLLYGVSSIAILLAYYSDDIIGICYGNFSNHISCLMRLTYKFIGTIHAYFKCERIVYISFRVT